MLLHRSFLPSEGRQTPQKLEDYAKLYASYTNLIQRQADMMRHNPEAMKNAYDRVAAEFAAEQLNAQNKLGTQEVLADLNEYARRCDINPNSFDDCVRISFAASGFVQVMMNFVIGNLDRRDMELFLARSNQLMQSKETQPIPTKAPAICKFCPDDAPTSSVTDADIAYWRLKPEELVGKCFTTTEEIMRRTFLIQDYYVKRAGPRYDVVFEDTGLEVVDVLDTNEVLSMVKEADLILT